MNTDFLSLFDNALQSSAQISPLAIFLRLLMALILGAVVAWVYRKSSQDSETGPSFPMTLVLLSVLIAMVTQVIGNNVALAFSLVGALSVVRFRTIVRDTRDTAYVIFAVVVGMAVGAANLWVAVLGIAVIGLASWLVVATGIFASSSAEYSLRLRCAVGREPQALAAGVIGKFLSQCELLGVSTSKQGLGLDYLFGVRLRAGMGLQEFVGELALVEGIQEVRMERSELD